jgi:hypothetical protein
VRYANQLLAEIESRIVGLKGDKPHWGARKIRELLVRRLDGDVRVPAKSTIHAVLTGTASSSRPAAGALVAPRPGRPDSAGVLSDNA